MSKYIAKRIIYFIPVLFGIVFLVYSIMYLAPGDPARMILGDKVPQAQVDALREEMGLNKPFLVQFFTYLTNILHGDFGTSYQLGMPVTDIILKIRFPITLIMAASSMLLAVIFSIPIGTLSAVKQYTVIDSITVVFALLLTSIPVFWLGLMLILLFSLKLGWFPSSGFDGVKSFVLPAITLALVNSAQIIRMTRSSMLEVLRQDFVRTARAKGASETRVIFKHALKNAIIPVLTVIGINFGIVLGGSAIAETVFGIPGMGIQMVTSIRQKDIPVVMGAVLFVAFTFSVVNLLIDILYTLFDPRIRTD
ncbi:ABC transporter permease [Enterocloster citroniae]|uniref:ABC transporter permease n=1 Tax=Enterocloster citroniae TaxID=358743 RepID=UPI0034A1E34B